MLSVLGIVVFINYIDNFYWQKVDTEELLQWFVDNTTRVDANFKQQLEAENEEANPIYVAVFDEQNVLLENKSIGIENTGESNKETTTKEMLLVYRYKYHMDEFQQLRMANT